MTRQQIEKLCGLAHLRRRGDMQVRAMELATNSAVLHLQRPQDVVARARIRGRSQRDPRHAGELIGQTRETAVLRAEFMAPLRNAMRLVDREQRQPQA